ncbi:polyketide synthase dehydratase domain-containing protein, partial [Streptomyces sp. NPDC007206]|uniref:polyketide synthase dehydratase domain-containing protein n=1 Tax=Streptomyces sp. NPDC007206 TaxID=3154317 RepID=UPI0033D34DD1
PFYLVRERQPWPAPKDADGRELPRRAGVSSFGLGGVNAHVVLEEYVAPEGSETPAASPAPLPVVLSARHPDVLRDLAGQWVTALERGDYRDADLPSIAYTSLTGRTPMTERLAVLAGGVDDLRRRLESWLRGESGQAVRTGRVRRGSDTPDAVTCPEPGPVDGPVRRDWDRALTAWLDGADVDWERWWTGPRPRRVSLPTYPFQLRRYWIDTTAPAGTRAAAPHPLLHNNTSDLTEQRYTSRFTGREPLLAGHRVRGVPVLPGAAQLEMAHAAARLASGDDARAWALGQVAWTRPLTVERPTDVEVALTTRPDGSLSYEVRSRGADGATVVHGHGRLRRRTPAAGERLDLPALLARCDGGEADAEAIYERFARRGLDYGPALRALRRLHSGSGLAVARLEAPASARPDGAGYVVDPGLLDAALQATSGLFTDDGAGSTALPFALGGLEVLRPTPATGWAVARFDADDRPGPVRRMDVDVCDDDGEVCVRLRGFTARDITANDRTGGLAGTGPEPRPTPAPTAGHEPAPAPAAGHETDGGAPDDAYLLHLIEAVSHQDLSVDDFKRSLNGARK